MVAASVRDVYSGAVAGPPDASTFLTLAFAGFAMALALGVVALVGLAGRRLGEPAAATRRWTVAALAASAGWMGLAAGVADAGVLADFGRRPPPFALLLLSVFAAAAVLAFGRVGRRLVLGLPMWLIVLSEAFRAPLEWLMHRAADEGVMPVQMSYSGWNFDVVTGLTALPVAWLLRRGGRPLLLAAWNTLGTLLLANILTIAVASTPMIAAFGPDRLNTWVAYSPFVFLPTVMVLWALVGHLVIWRALLTGTPWR